MRQVAVLGLSLVPFALSTAIALIMWELLEPFAALWRLIAIVLVWIAAFAAGTQVFWRVVRLFSPESMT